MHKKIMLTMRSTNEGDDIVFQAVQYNNVEFLAELLAENPSLVNAKESNGRTALHLAALEGMDRCAELLLQAGADIDAISGIQDSFRTPLIMAAAQNRTGMLALLIANGADLFYIDSEGHSALQLAQMQGNDSCAHIIISAIERLHREIKIKNQRLCAASIDGNLSIVLEVLSDVGHRTLKKQVLNGFGPDVKSALYLAAEHGRADVVNGLLTVSDHSIIFEPTGDTVLHAAIASKDEATVEIILRKFPYLMAITNQEKSLPLHWACRCGNPAIVRILLEMEYAQEELKFFELPNDGFRTEIGKSNKSRGYLFPCDLNAADQAGMSPLYLAVTEGHTDIVDIFCKFQLPILDGTNPIGTQISYEEMENPIQFDTYVNGRTPLMIASSNGFVEIVKLILSFGHVDVNLPIALTDAETSSSDEAHCQEGSGALFEAAKKGHVEIIRLLFQYGAFDYGNRALALIQSTKGEDEIFGLFLENLAFVDTEHQIKQIRKEENGKPIYGALEKVSSSQFNTANEGLKACQLNWKEAEIRELKLDWLLAAATRINPKPIVRQPTRHLPLLAITKIDLSSNHLTTLPHFLFTQLHSLHHLNLSKNALYRFELPLDQIDWQSPCLEILNLDDNQLEDLPVQLFKSAHFPQLRHLSVISNRLRRVPASIWTAPRLLELNLSDNQICELTSYDFRRKHQLGGNGQQGGTAAARISRHKQRGDQQKTAEEIRPTTHQERQSRSAKREPPQKFVESSPRGSRDDVARKSSGLQRSTSSTTGSEDGREQQQNLMEVDIQRLNIWQKHIQLTNIEDDILSKETSSPLKRIDAPQSSSLQILNISGNKFTRMPTCLACVCPRLSKLDFSKNQLTNLGPIECLPSALQHLDVSHNRLNRCFIEMSTHLKQRLGQCEVPNNALEIRNISAQGPMSIVRHSRSRSKSVARSQRSLSVIRNSNANPATDHQMAITDNTCIHKSHCRLEALTRLNLANNALTSLELLVPLCTERGRMANESELTRFLLEKSKIHPGKDEEISTMSNWKEGGEQLKPYVLFPAITSLDVSENQIHQLSPVIHLLNSLAVLNLSNNAELERLPSELGLLEKLWNIGLNGCQLNEESQQIRQIVQEGNYKTTEILSQLSTVAYPKMKLMLLGNPGAGKTTLLQNIRLEGTVPKKSLQNESWSRRMGHSPVKGSPSHANSNNRAMPRSTSQQRVVPQASNIYPVDVAEWIYEPRRSSSKSATQSKSDMLKGPVNFRTWDFDGIKQREQLPIEICFFTRRSIYLLLWKVTDGEIGLAELQEWLTAIQEQAPNSSVLIVGTHTDFVREQQQRFPKEYLAALDRQIQERFIAGPDPEKRGLPRVLGSIYLSCKSREDIKSLCSLIYTCACHSTSMVRSGSKLKLAEKVPASFVNLEQIAVHFADEMRATQQEPIMHFQEFWSKAREHLLFIDDKRQQQKLTGEKRPPQFRNTQDFRQACQFLHENGVICYFDDTLLRDYVFLDPPWLCAFLFGILNNLAHKKSQNNSSPQSPASLSQIHQNSLVQSTELYNAMKQSIKQFLKSALPMDPSLSKQYRFFRQCGMGLLQKFELALPCQNGKQVLLASLLPDEYLLRADYPGAKVCVRTKLDKLKLRWNKSNWPKSIGQEEIDSNPMKVSPIRHYLEHRRLSRAQPIASIENGNSFEIHRKEVGLNTANPLMAEMNDFVKILSIEHCKEEYLRRLYLMHFIPQGLWPRLITRIMDDERVGNAISKMFLLNPVTNCSQQRNEAEPAFGSEATIALSRTLNSGRILSLVQRTSCNSQKEQPYGEEETSFIVVNRADEVTEESSEINTEFEEEIPTVIKCCENAIEASDEEGSLTSLDANGIEWLLWRTGLEVRALGTFLLSLRQFLPLATVQDLNYSTHQLYRRFEDGQWRPLTTPEEENLHGINNMVELLVPRLKIRIKWRETLWELSTDQGIATRILVLISSIIDDLLEDWYPHLGTRFICSSHGFLLVDRLIPCDCCSIEAIQEEERYWIRENINRNPAASLDYQPQRLPIRSISTTKFNNKQKTARKMLPKSKSSTTTPLDIDDGISVNNKKSDKKTTSKPSSIYMFSIEECILKARNLLIKARLNESLIEEVANDSNQLACPRHGQIGWRKMENMWNGPDLSRMCPDLLFSDLEDEWLVKWENLSRGKMLGRGAFGFVFSGILPAQCRRRLALAQTPSGVNSNSDTYAVALKVLEPIEPNSQSISTLGSAQAAFRAFAMKWKNDLMEQATRAYCTARQELCMLSELCHPHCTQMLAFCAQPMTLLLELAPNGSLDKALAEYRKHGQRLHVKTLQQASLQIAKALEYLHIQQHIIYRDLKSENVLIWRFPMLNHRNRARTTSPSDVLLKLGDYGISRFSYPFGCKGYGGTEGFMAPEIMRYNGEKEYGDRVDSFSFGMFLFELFTLRQPYEGHQMQQMKERILEAQRPTLTEKELLHPTNMLDLMVQCWEERAELRPSSFQLVGICSSPEFAHLLDMALLADGEEINDESGIVSILHHSSHSEDGPSQWTCLIPISTAGRQNGSPQKRSAKQSFSLLQCSPFGWTEKKIFIPPESGSTDSGLSTQITKLKITVFAQVYDEFLWLGSESGQINIFAFKSDQNGPPFGSLLHSFDTIEAFKNCPGQMVQLCQEGNEFDHEPLRRINNNSGINNNPLQPNSVQKIETFIERQIVVIGFTTAVLLCRWIDRDSMPQFLTRIQLKNECLFTIAIMPSLRDWQILTGHMGLIFTHNISSSTDKLLFSTSATHSEESKEFTQKLTAVAFLVASKCVKNTAWSVMEYDSRLFFWHDSQLQKALNCEKFLPTSESLTSLELGTAGGIEEIPQNYITALELIDLAGPKELDGEEQLLVGTSRGILLVIEATKMAPLSCFRPYSGRVERIIACPKSIQSRPSTNRILQIELLSTTADKTAMVQNPQLPPMARKKRSAMLVEKSRSIMLKAAGLGESGTNVKNREALEKQQSFERSPSVSSSIGISEVRTAVDGFYEAVKSGMRGMFNPLAGDASEMNLNSEASKTDETYFVTIGSNYRPLLDRFLGNNDSSQSSSSKEAAEQSAAIFWHATQHWSSQSS